MIQFERIINTVDLHTAGEPLRLITSGFPQPPGATILEKRCFLQDNYDHLRKLLMLEPRGHSGMYGCLITPPVTPDGDFGVIFMHNEGYSTMCGHGIIAVTKAALELGIIEGKGDEPVLLIDSPAGRIISRVHLEEGRISRVSFDNVPSFVFARGVEVELGGVGAVQVDIAFGGAFYAFVEAERLGVKVEPASLEQITELGMQIKRRVMEKMEVIHPLEPGLHGIYGTIFTDPLRSAGEALESKNCCIFAEAQIDRSPTGTGTSARLALLHAGDRIALGQRFINHSVIDTVFEGQVTKSQSVGEYTGVITQVSGTAQIMGFNQIVLEPGDPLPQGLSLGVG